MQVEHRRRQSGGPRECRRCPHQRVDLHGAAELVVLQDRRLVVGRRTRAGEALDAGKAALGDGVGLIEQARDDRPAGPARPGPPRAVCPVSRHSTDIDMLVSSLVQIVSRMLATGADVIEAALSAARSRSIRALPRSSHSPTSSMLRSGERLATIPGAINLVRGKDHAADDPLPGNGRSQLAAGIEKAEVRRHGTHRRPSPISYHQGMPFWANTTAVWSRSSGGRPVARLPTRVRLQRRDHDILRPQLRRVVRRLDAAP